MLLLLSLLPVVVFATAVVFTDNVIAAAAVLVCACPLPGCACSAFVCGRFGLFGLVRLLFVLIHACLPSFVSFGLLVLVWLLFALICACPASRLCLY